MFGFHAMLEKRKRGAVMITASLRATPDSGTAVIPNSAESVTTKPTTRYHSARARET